MTNAPQLPLSRALPRIWAESPPNGESVPGSPRSTSSLNSAGTFTSSSSVDPHIDEHTPGEYQDLQKNISRLRFLLSEELQKSKAFKAQLLEKERELKTREETISILQSDLKKTKHQKQQIETDFAELSAQYINSQTDIVQNAEQHNEEIAVLKKQTAMIQNENNEMIEKIHKLKSQVRDLEQVKSKINENENSPEKQMERLQENLLTKELQSLLSQARTENSALLERNQGLRDENECYQYLLIENTITGRLPEFYSESSISNEPCFESNDIEELRKVLSQQHYQYNALRKVQEKLVAHLLENKIFSKAVEESLSTSTVNNFRTRTLYKPSDAMSIKSVDSMSSPLSMKQSPILNNPSAWSHRIFSSSSRNSFMSQDTEQPGVTSSGSDVSSEPSELNVSTGLKALKMYEPEHNRVESLTEFRKMRLK